MSQARPLLQPVRAAGGKQRDSVLRIQYTASSGDQGQDHGASDSRTDGGNRQRQIRPRAGDSAARADCHHQCRRDADVPATCVSSPHAPRRRKKRRRSTASTACSTPASAAPSRAGCRSRPPRSAAAWEQGKRPLLVGGTGMYVKALIDGLAELPPIPQEVRQRLRAMDPAERRALLETKDPAMAAVLKPGDTQRNLRALEVLEATGPQPSRLAGRAGDAGLSGCGICMLPYRAAARRAL